MSGWILSLKRKWSFMLGGRSSEERLWDAHTHILFCAPSYWHQLSSLQVILFSDAHLVGKFPCLCRIPEPLKRSPLAQGGRGKESHSRITPVRLPPRPQFLQRLDHGLLLDFGQSDKTGMNPLLLSSESPTNDKWLAKKTAIIRTCDNWKNPKMTSDDFSLPNLPGGNIRFCAVTYSVCWMKA
jgi:hypothetical protein